jgi:hypothetical protein
MDLHHALQTLHSKISETSTDAKYKASEKEMLAAVLENQVRISEGMLILGTILHTAIGDKVEITVMPSKEEEKH